jgi:ribosomal protein L10
MENFEEVAQAFALLANAHEAMRKAFRAKQSESLVDQDLLAALIVSHPNPGALREIFLMFSTETHAQRTVMGSALPAERVDPETVKEMAQVQARRMTHWQSVIDDTTGRIG